MSGLESSIERAAALLEGFVAGEELEDPLLQDLVRQLWQRWRAAGGAAEEEKTPRDWAQSLDVLSRADPLAGELVREIAPLEPLPATRDLFYLDLVIRIQEEGGQLRARLGSNPGGHVGHGDLRLEEWIGHDSVLDRFSAGLSSRDLGRRHGNVHEPEWAELGRGLFRALFVQRIRDAWFFCAGLLAGRPDLGVRIRLVFDEESERKYPLAAIPWELMRDPDTNRPLCLDVRTPLVRGFEGAGHGAPRPRLKRRRRVLLVAARPSDLEPIAVERERQLIEETLAPFGATFRAEPDLGDLREKVAQGGFAILHFMGHGDFQPGGGGVLFFADRSGRSVPVASSVLCQQLAGIPLELVVLTSCSGGAVSRLSRHDPFTGVAAALITDGLDAVLAMQVPVPDVAAVAFARELYRRLAVGEALESAVTEARLAIQAAIPEAFDWAIPVLYRQNRDFRLG